MCGKRNTTKAKKHKSKNRIKYNLSNTYGSKYLDQIKENLNRDYKLQYNEDLAGKGLFYCIECDRCFENDNILNLHYATKNHKKRVKALRDTFHSNKDAEEAAGLYN